MSAITIVTLVAPWIAAYVVFLVYKFRALRDLSQICDAPRPVPPSETPITERTYAREVIDPRRPKRGACGVLGCPNSRPHSHVADLMRRLKEPRR